MDSARPGPPDQVPAAPAWLSVVVVTFNEEDRIGACLESAGFCDERVVVDAHSTDRTREIAAALGARVIERDWAGYRSQKEFGVAAAANHWVLCIDADERVSGELRAEIEALRSRGFRGMAGASMRRRTWFHGAPLRFGTAAPDRLTRLFDRRRGGWRGGEVHEFVRVDGPVERLRGRLLHHPYRSDEHHRRKLDRYATLMAEQMLAAGRRGSVVNVLVNPPWCFVRGFLLRLGFLDGWRGLLFAWRESGYVLEKYLRLRRLARANP